jgi:hypothetical protein
MSEEKDTDTLPEEKRCKCVFGTTDVPDELDVVDGQVVPVNNQRLVVKELCDEH